MLRPLRERPEVPTVRTDPNCPGDFTVELNPRYSFTHGWYKKTILDILTESVGQEITQVRLDAIGAAVNEVLLRAWLCGDLLVDWPEPSPEAVDDALQVPVEMTEEDEAQFLVRLFEKESCNPLNDREHTLLVEFWEFLNNQGKLADAGE